MKVLILVHPGSACGSADFNLGRNAARDARQRLIDELNGWSGGVVVIDGLLSSDLLDSKFSPLNDALLGVIDRAEIEGLESRRIYGCDSDDHDQVQAIEQCAHEIGVTAHGMEFFVTGAWFNGKGGGCVGSVLGELRRLGLRACVLESAIMEDVDDDADEDSFATVADRQ